MLEPFGALVHLGTLSQSFITDPVEPCSISGGLCWTPLESWYIVPELPYRSFGALLDFWIFMLEPSGALVHCPKVALQILWSPMKPY